MLFLRSLAVVPVLVLCVSSLGATAASQASTSDDLASRCPVESARAMWGQNCDGLRIEVTTDASTSLRTDGLPYLWDYPRDIASGTSESAPALFLGHMNKKKNRPTKVKDLLLTSRKNGISDLAPLQYRYITAVPTDDGTLSVTCGVLSEEASGAGYKINLRVPGDRCRVKRSGAHGPFVSANEPIRILFSS